MRPDELDLKRLKAFRLVARHGNLRQAAQRLHQSIPAVSGKLRKLEEDLGVTLFERAPNKLILTEVGRRFLNEADAVVARAERAIASLRQPSEPAGRIAVSIGSDQSWYFAPRISAFLKRFPKVELTLSIVQAADSLQRLRQGDLDLAIGVFPPLAAEFDQCQVVETSLSLLCRKNHPLLSLLNPTLEEIANHRLIVLPKHAETRKLVDRAMSLAHIDGLNIIEVANCHTASTFVDLDVGVALVHSICCANAAGETTARMELGRQFGKIGFSLVSRTDDRDNTLLATLIERLAS
ncbi:DNA-binding transcriptional LysR family regulator [Sphingomonas vulcanisoli]|uniref:DNA-binding transcriptional LysR family regulator n=1 Tax=Sphingomonas vulcanisoli TaxID=1658060 RepID=A0ABX0TW11_9SPHN|nr:LysR family transcriptional regulator [Sphingomonas vulcanisoli]NIJ09228.1 DNA-binding transcriptional LysR family regulator [Sphingomonas vulcanisoli]